MPRQRQTPRRGGLSIPSLPFLPPPGPPHPPGFCVTDTDRIPEPITEANLRHMVKLIYCHVDY